MKSLTIRNISPSVLDKARLIAIRDRRSLNQTLLLLLEAGLESDLAKKLAQPLNTEIQSELFASISGSWKDSRSAPEIIKDIRS